MADAQPPGAAPRRSYPGPQTNSSAQPRHALGPEEPPILAGYTYQPGRASTPPPPPPQAGQPLTAQPPVADSIENYRPKRGRGWIVLIIVLVVAAIAGGVLINNLASSGSDRPSTRPTSYTSQTMAGGTGFADSSVSGYWRITHTQWEADQVRLTVELKVDSGTLYYAFYAYANADRSQLTPTWTSDTDLVPGFLGPGQSITGTLTFKVDRQPMTLVMISNNATQLSALTIDE